jgi:hypothetical protein
MRQWRAGQRSASGQCLKHHVQLFKRVTCKRVCTTCAWLARRARMVRCTHGACVTSMLCARVLVCKAQSSERGRGSGEAQHASFRFRFFFAPRMRSKNAKRAYSAACLQIVALLFAGRSLAQPRRRTGDSDAGGDAAR